MSTHVCPDETTMCLPLQARDATHSLTRVGRKPWYVAAPVASMMIPNLLGARGNRKEQALQIITVLIYTVTTDSAL